MPILLEHRPRSAQLSELNRRFFSEVKASRDELSEDQKTWIRGNHAGLHLPFKLVKIHRMAVGS